MFQLYTFLLVIATVTADLAPAKYVGRTGHIHVESHSRYLDVIADNYQVYCEVQPASGAVIIKGLTKSFEFKLGALDRAFNSDRFSMANFAKFSYEGTITNPFSIKWDKPGRYPIQVEGFLHMGTYKRKTSARGTLHIKDDGSMRAETSFVMRIEEESMQTINRLMKEKLPSMVALDANNLGISRDIQLELKSNLRPRG